MKKRLDVSWVTNAPLGWRSADCSRRRRVGSSRHQLSCAMTPPAQRIFHHGQQLRLPLPDALMADVEPAQQHDLAEIPQCQPVAQPAKHHEGDDVARQRRTVEDTATALVELLAAVPAPEPT